MREVSSEEGNNLAAKHGLIFLETSAQSGENIDEAFGHLVKYILEKREEVGSDLQKSAVIKIEPVEQ